MQGVHAVTVFRNVYFLCHQKFRHPKIIDVHVSKRKTLLDGYLVYSGFISSGENSKDCKTVLGILEK